MVVAEHPPRRLATCVSHGSQVLCEVFDARREVTCTARVAIKKIFFKRKFLHINRSRETVCEELRISMA